MTSGYDLVRMEHASKLKWLLAGSWIGALLTLSSFIGLAGTTWSVVQAFEQLDAAGMEDPNVMGAVVGEHLISTVAGIVVAIPAFILFIACYIPYRRLRNFQRPLFLRSRPSKTHAHLHRALKEVQILLSRNLPPTEHRQMRRRPLGVMQEEFFLLQPV